MKLWMIAILLLLYSAPVVSQLVEINKAGNITGFHSVNAIYDNTGAILISGSTDLIKITNRNFDIIACPFNEKGDNSTLALAQDADNNIWTSTSNGWVGVYNGSTWQTWDKLAGEVALVTAIAVDSRNTIWAAGSKKLFKYNGVAWTVITPAVSISSNVKDIICQKDTLWLAADGQGLVKHYGSYWITYPMNDLDGQNSNVSLAVDAQGNKWLSSTEFGVGKFDGTAWTAFPKTEYPSLTDIEKIYVDNSGTVWVSSRSKGVSFFNGNTWENISFKQGLFTNNYACLVSDKTTSWFCSNTGVSAYEGGNITNYLSEAHIAGDYFATQFFDSQDRMWISTYDGTTLLDSLDSADDILNATLKNTYFTVIKEDLYGTIWAGTLDGVWRYKAGTWTQFTTTDGLIHNTINDIAIDGENNKWFATMGGISTFNDYFWISYSEADGLPLTTISNIAIDNQANVWISAFSQQNSVSVFNGEYWNTLETPLDDSVYILSMELDLAGRLWLGTTKGLYVFDGELWSDYLTETNPASNISSILVDPVNNLLLLNQGDKVLRFDGETSQPVPSFEDFSGTLRYDNNGFLWGNNGSVIRRGIMAEPYLKISQRYAWLREWNRELTINIVSNSSWEIVSEAYWLNFMVTAGQGTSEILAFADENFEMETRETLIEISSPGLFTQYVRVFQDPFEGAVRIGSSRGNKLFTITKGPNNFRIEGDDFKNADIYAVNGHMLFHTTMRSINCQSLHAGVYLIKIYNKQNSYETHKITITP